MLIHKLIDRELEELQEKIKTQELDESGRILLSAYQRDKILIDKLVCAINMCGGIDEVEKRFEGANLYIMKQEDYLAMVKAAEAYNKIEQIVNCKQKGESDGIH